MYRTGCTMYDEVSIGNPGKVPYCTEQDKIEPDCQHCKRPYVTNADRMRAMSDEELATKLWMFTCVHVFDNKVKCKDDGCKKCWLAWLKQEGET